MFDHRTLNSSLFFKTMPEINIATEGEVDAAFCSAICIHCGFERTITFPAGGKTKLDPKIPSYFRASKFMKWLIVRDLDREYECEPLLKRALGNFSSSRDFSLRIAKQSLESWILADVDGISAWLRVSKALISRDPDSLRYPKQYLVNLAQRSRSRNLREGLTPTTSSGATVGPEYEVELLRFAKEGWSPKRAYESGNSPSFSKCVERLQEML